MHDVLERLSTPETGVPEAVKKGAIAPSALQYFQHGIFRCNIFIGREKLEICGTEANRNEKFSVSNILEDIAVP